MLVKVFVWTKIYWKREGTNGPFGIMYSIWGAGEGITGVGYTYISSCSQFVSRLHWYTSDVHQYKFFHWVIYYLMKNSMRSLPRVLQADSFRTILSILVFLTSQICLMHCWYITGQQVSLEEHCTMALMLNFWESFDDCYFNHLTSASISQHL